MSSEPMRADTPLVLRVTTAEGELLGTVELTAGELRAAQFAPTGALALAGELATEAGLP